jgi:drug/metabolite transporter (DMT)-like permease
MWETAVAFAVWGAYGSVLTAARIDPVVTAIARTIGIGLVLSIFVRARVPWRSRVLWLSGLVLLVDEVLYSVSAVSGPVAIIGLAYGCVPVIVPFVSRLAGAESSKLEPQQWFYLALAFAGNLLIFVELHAAQVRFTLAAAFAFLAALLFCVLPIASARLQHDGLSSWAVLKGQSIVGAVGAAPLAAGLSAAGAVAPVDGPLFQRSGIVGLVNAILFTLIPFSLWYRGIARDGVARTAVCCFAEPLVATCFSLFVLRDAPPTPILLTGVALVFAGIALSTKPQ